MSFTLERSAPDESAVDQLISQLQISSKDFSILGPGPHSEVKESYVKIFSCSLAITEVGKIITINSVSSLIVNSFQLKEP